MFFTEFQQERDFNEANIPTFTNKASASARLPGEKSQKERPSYTRCSPPQRTPAFDSSIEALIGVISR